jgi:hypothetical protein
MERPLGVGLLWLGFEAFHIGLGTTSIRTRLVAALGRARLHGRPLARARNSKGPA